MGRHRSVSPLLLLLVVLVSAGIRSVSFPPVVAETEEGNDDEVCKWGDREGMLKCRKELHEKNKDPYLPGASGEPDYLDDDRVKVGQYVQGYGSDYYNDYTEEAEEPKEVPSKKNQPRRRNQRVRGSKFQSRARRENNDDDDGYDYYGSSYYSDNEEKPKDDQNIETEPEEKGAKPKEVQIIETKPEGTQEKPEKVQNTDETKPNRGERLIGKLFRRLNRYLNRS